MDVEWDPAKARSNLKKHGISFSDAEAVLFDPFALSMEDPAGLEQRFLALGCGGLGKTLVVVYAYTQRDSIRIISARYATSAERKRYEKGI